MLAAQFTQLSAQRVNNGGVLNTKPLIAMNECTLNIIIIIIIIHSHPAICAVKHFALTSNPSGSQ